MMPGTAPSQDEARQGPDGPDRAVAMTQDSDANWALDARPADAGERGSVDWANTNWTNTDWTGRGALSESAARVRAASSRGAGRQPCAAVAAGAPAGP
jgi:hypothetical protein